MLPLKLWRREPVKETQLKRSGTSIRKFLGMLGKLSRLHKTLNRQVTITICNRLDTETHSFRRRLRTSCTAKSLSLPMNQNREKLIWTTWDLLMLTHHRLHRSPNMKWLEMTVRWHHSFTPVIPTCLDIFPSACLLNLSEITMKLIGLLKIHSDTSTQSPRKNSTRALIFRLRSRLRTSSNGNRLDCLR